MDVTAFNTLTGLDRLCLTSACMHVSPFFCPIIGGCGLVFRVSSLVLGFLYQHGFLPGSASERQRRRQQRHWHTQRGIPSQSAREHASSSGASMEQLKFPLMDGGDEIDRV